MTRNIKTDYSRRAALAAAPAQPRTHPTTGEEMGTDTQEATAWKLTVENLQRDNAALRAALKFYADKDHFMLADEDEWDTVSGEPQNFWCDEAGTATVEDGTFARLALAGTAPAPSKEYAELPESCYEDDSGLKTYDSGDMRTFADATHALRIQQPAPSAAPEEPLQAFDSPRAKSLMRAWEEGWEACRDAEYVGEEAQNDAFNSSHTLTLCLAEDQLLPTPQADSQPAPVMAYQPLPEPFIGVQNQPWGGHAEVIRSAIGEDGVIPCFTAGQMVAYADATHAARAPADSVLEDAAPSQAARDVLAERQRQISVEGWTPEHDDEHECGDMARAAACYLLVAAGYPYDDVAILRFWPWIDAWKPTDQRRNLVKAGALILAEIERIDRAARKQGANHD